MRHSKISLALGACALLCLLVYLASWGRNSFITTPALEAAEEESLAAQTPRSDLPRSSVAEDVVAQEPAPQLPVSRAAVEPRTPRVKRTPSEAASLVAVPEPEPLAIAGDISGRLVSESGYWSDGELPEPDTLIVELVRLEEPALELRAVLSVEETEQGKLLRFEFKDVPVGNYELSLFNLGSHHWAPTTMRVRAPATGLDFVRYDREAAIPMAFVVRDAQTGESIAEFSSAHLEQTVSESSGVFMHAGPFDGDAFPRDSSFRWSVWARGYRASFGDETAFELQDGRLVAQVDLHRGWSARLVVLGREPSLRPLYRARVLIDGSFAGVTAQDGSLVIERDELPESIEVEYKGWTLENDPFEPRPGTTPELRGHVLPLILREPD